MDPKKKSEFLNKNMFWMAIGLLVIFFVYVFCITFINIPKDNQKYVDIIVGFLSGTTVANIIGYYFGTSSSNHQKDKNLDDIIGMHRENYRNYDRGYNDRPLPVEIMNGKPIDVKLEEKLFDPKDLPPPLDPDAE